MCTETDRSLSKHDSAQIFEEFSFCAAKLFVFIVFAQHISQAAHEPGITFGIYVRATLDSSFKSKLNRLDRVRKKRHRAVYRMAGAVSEREAKGTIEFAEEFVALLDNLI